MALFHRILVPTDFSPNSLHAFRYARELATSMHCEIVLAHVTPPLVEYMYDGDLLDDQHSLEARIAHHVEAKMTALADDFGSGTSVRCVASIGTAHAELVRLATDEGCDLIVMATHGYTGSKHVLLGSVSERVARSASVPVMIVH